MGNEFWAIPKHIAQDEDLSLSAKMVYGVLFTRMNGQQEAWPSQKNIAESTGMSLPTIKRAVKELVDKEFINSVQRGCRRSNLYSLKYQNDTSRKYQNDTSYKKRTKKRTIINKNPDEIWNEMLSPYRGKYAPSMLQDFEDYWRAKNLNGKKELWEKKGTFDIGRRLSTWDRNGKRMEYERQQKKESRFRDMNEAKRVRKQAMPSTGPTSIGSILNA